MKWLVKIKQLNYRLKYTGHAKKLIKKYQIYFLSILYTYLRFIVEIYIFF